jgi:hypothetical protein
VVGAQSSFDTLLDEAQALPIAGWGFSVLGDRITIAALPWDFDEIVASHARMAPDLLDIAVRPWHRLRGDHGRSLEARTGRHPPKLSRVVSRTGPQHAWLSEIQ